MAALTALTWLAGTPDRYRKELVLAFTDGFPGRWAIHGPSENASIGERSVLLHPRKPGKVYAKHFMVLPRTERIPAGAKLRISARVGILTPGDEQLTGDPASIMIVFSDSTDQNVSPSLYLNVHRLLEPHGVILAERTVAIPESARMAILFFSSHDSMRHYEMTDARVEIVTPLLWPRILSALLALAWAVLLFVLGRWCYERVSRARFALAVGVLLLTVLGVLMPESLVAEFIRPLLSSLMNAEALDSQQLSGVFFKVGHYLFFLLLGLIVWSNLRYLRLSRYLALLFLVVFAFATEGIQLHLFDRTTRASDIVIDLAGAATGILLVMIGNWFFSRKRRLARAENMQ